MTSVNIILNEDQTEGTQATISQWLYAVGDVVEKNQPIVELETDKVMMEIIAPVTGQLSKIILDTGDDVIGGNILGTIDSDIIGTGKKKKISLNISSHDKTAHIAQANIESNDNSQHQSISPAVRRLCKQHGLNISQVNGTGKGNRVTSRDIQAFLSQSNDSYSQLTKNKATDISVNNSSEHLPISGMRQSIASHMVDSLLHTAPHVTSVFNLDLSTIIAHRKQYKQNYQDQAVNLTFTAYFIAASAVAIKQVPLINSQLHDKTIEIFSNINIGIGTALADKGLIVPVLKNCEDKDLFAIAKNLTELTDKARNNKLKPSDVKGGTFTISNHGVSGSLIATPIIINQPQSAILGIGKMEKRVIVKEVAGDDVMLIKPMCYVSLTIDHRVLDAHQTNQFLSVFVETLENWQ